MKRFAKLLALLSLLLLTFSLHHLRGVEAGNTPAGQDTVLKAADITPKLFPERVYFRGQTAPAQLRNTGGVHFADDFYARFICEGRQNQLSHELGTVSHKNANRLVHGFLLTLRVRQVWVSMFVSA